MTRTFGFPSETREFELFLIHLNDILLQEKSLLASKQKNRRNKPTQGKLRTIIILRVQTYSVVPEFDFVSVYIFEFAGFAIFRSTPLLLSLFCRRLIFLQTMKIQAIVNYRKILLLLTASRSLIFQLLIHGTLMVVLVECLRKNFV